MPRTTAAERAEQEAQQAEDQVEVKIDAEDSVGGDSRLRVPLAGLLADQPNLREEQHTREEWQKLQAEYNASTRDTEPAPPEDE